MLVGWIWGLGGCGLEVGWPGFGGWGVGFGVGWPGFGVWGNGSWAAPPQTNDRFVEDRSLSRSATHAKYINQ